MKKPKTKRKKHGIPLQHNSKCDAKSFVSGIVEWKWKRMRKGIAKWMKHKNMYNVEIKKMLIFFQQYYTIQSNETGREIKLRLLNNDTDNMVI